MSVWLTPELKPFYRRHLLSAGVEMGPSRIRRHPPGDRARLAGGAARSFASRPIDRRDSCAAREPERAGRSRAGGRPCWRARRRSSSRRSTHGIGGFGDAPKFPRPDASCCSCCASTRSTGADRAARHRRCRRCARWRSAACAITSAAASTAIRSTRAWRVPHFEKMLYDQAQLVLAYLEARAGVRRPVLHRRRRGHAALRDARDDRRRRADSISAEDADSVPPEHAGDTGRPQDGRRVLPVARRGHRRAARRRMPASCAAISGSSRAATPRPIRIRSSSARTSCTSPKGLEARRRGDRPRRRRGVGDPRSAPVWRMFQARLARPRPHLDDKVLTAWNGLMIAAFARMARLMHGLGADGARAGASLSRGRARMRRRSSVSGCGTPTRGRCCGATAMATPRSRATPRTTPT